MIICVRNFVDVYYDFISVKHTDAFVHEKVTVTSRAKVSSTSAASDNTTRTDDDSSPSAKSVSAWLCGGGGVKITSSNIGWAISFALSLTYLVLFITYDPGANPCSFDYIGFCVTNYTGVECPPLNNSHVYAFGVDFLFTVAALALPRISGGESNLIGGVVLAIASHGLLRLFLGLTECKLDGGSLLLPPGGGGIIDIVGTFLFGLFTWFIAFFTLADFSQISSVILNVVLSVGVAALTVWLSTRPPADRGILSIFLTTQLLASFTLFCIPKQNGPDLSLAGKLFVGPCVVSIIELIACCTKECDQGLFNKLGGRVWYDLTLHTSLLASLLPPASTISP